MVMEFGTQIRPRIWREGSVGLGSDVIQPPQIYIAVCSTVGHHPQRLQTYNTVIKKQHGLTHSTNMSSTTSLLRFRFRFRVGCGTWAQGNCRRAAALLWRTRCRLRSRTGFLWHRIAVARSVRRSSVRISDHLFSHTFSRVKGNRLGRQCQTHRVETRTKTEEKISYAVISGSSPSLEVVSESSSSSSGSNLAAALCWLGVVPSNAVAPVVALVLVLEFGSKISIHIRQRQGWIGGLALARDIPTGISWHAIGLGR